MEKFILTLSLLLVSFSVLATTVLEDKNLQMPAQGLTQAGLTTSSLIVGGQVPVCERCENASLKLSDTKENAMNSATSTPGSGGSSSSSDPVKSDN